jgi:hypothetical protein
MNNETAQICAGSWFNELPANRVSRKIANEAYHLSYKPVVEPWLTA